MFKIILIYFITIYYLIANDTNYSIKTIDNEEFACFIEWLIVNDFNNNKPFRPQNENLQSSIIYFDKNMDILNYETTNHVSQFNFQLFIDLPYDTLEFKKGTKGIRYHYKNSTKVLYYDVFENGHIIVWADNSPIAKYICPNLTLNIEKIK